MATHALGPYDWLLEAKGGWRVGSGVRRDGAKQLDSPRHSGWHAPHVQALVAVNLDPLLHVVIDVGLPPGATMPAGWPIVPFDPSAVGDAESFWGRSVIAAALEDRGAEAARLEGTGLRARLVDLPGADLRVGLFEGAAAVAVEQVRRVRGRASLLDPKDSRAIAAAAVDANVPDAAAGDELLEALARANEGSDRQGDVALLDGVGDGPGAAFDLLGRVVVAGPSWRTDLKPRDN